MGNPYLFVVGCPRSGTTLLRHILSAHPQIVITPEAHWIPLWYQERIGLTPEGFVTDILIGKLLEHQKFGLFKLGPEDLASLRADDQPVSYSRFVTSIFDLYGKARGKKLVGNKTPDSVRRMQTLHSLWPRARFVHLIRDGRDVALSLMNWPKIRSKKPGTFPTWKEDPASTAALWWELNVRKGKETGRSLGPELYHEVFYESLVRDPETESKALCKFLGVEFDRVMLRWNELEPLPLEGSGSLRRGGKKAATGWMPITPRLRNWRSEMPSEQVERFEAVAGSLLSELGYSRSFPDVRSQAAVHSDLVRGELAGLPSDVRPYRTAYSEN